VGRRVHSLRELFTKTQIIGNINNGLLRSWAKDLQGEVGGLAEDAMTHQAVAVMVSSRVRLARLQYMNAGKELHRTGTLENGQKILG